MARSLSLAHPVGNNFPPAMRPLIFLFTLLLLGTAGRGQFTGADSTAAITYSRTFTAPLSRTQLYDAALLAWQRTFGLEPAAKLGTADRPAGTIEGAARINYRSSLLTAREETMGVISYRVTIQAGNGECTVRITQLAHTGNRNAIKGGSSFGTLTGTTVPPGPHPGISYRNAVRIWADIKGAADAKVDQLIAAFGAVLRQATAP